MIIYLDITDMAYGGGIHLYGKLKHYDWTCRGNDSPFTEYELTYVLSAHEAATFNKYEPGAYKAYRPGDTSQRFESRKRLRRVAISEWRERFPEGQVLVEGDNGAMPRRVLDGLTQEQRDRLGAIYEEGEAIRWFDDRRNDAGTQEICDRWFDMLHSFGVATPYLETERADD